MPNADECERTHSRRSSSVSSHSAGTPLRAFAAARLRARAVDSLVSLAPTGSPVGWDNDSPALIAVVSEEPPALVPGLWCQCGGHQSRAGGRSTRRRGARCLCCQAQEVRTQTPPRARCVAAQGMASAMLATLQGTAVPSPGDGRSRCDGEKSKHLEWQQHPRDAPRARAFARARGDDASGAQEEFCWRKHSSINQCIDHRRVRELDRSTRNHWAIVRRDTGPMAS